MHLILFRCRFIVGSCYFEIHIAFRTVYVFAQLPGFLLIYPCLSSAHRALFPLLISATLLRQQGPFYVRDVVGKFCDLIIFGSDALLQRNSKRLRFCVAQAIHLLGQLIVLRSQDGFVDTFFVYTCCLNVGPHRPHFLCQVFCALSGRL